MSNDRRSFASIGVQVADDWHVWCSTYTDQPPILTVGAGSATVTVSVRGKVADDNAVKFARDLLRQAQTFAAEVERLHAEQAARFTAARPEQAA